MNDKKQEPEKEFEELIEGFLKVKPSKKKKPKKKESKGKPKTAD